MKESHKESFEEYEKRIFSKKIIDLSSVVNNLNSKSTKGLLCRPIQSQLVKNSSQFIETFDEDEEEKNEDSDNEDSSSEKQNEETFSDCEEECKNIYREQSDFESLLDEDDKFNEELDDEELDDDVQDDENDENDENDYYDD